ncbi:MAG: hypothetical protein WCK92_08050 [Bacteroidota bacterium]
MNQKIWLEQNLNDLIEKSQGEDFQSEITDDDVITAKELINTNAYSTTEFFILLSSINLLNTAIKRPNYKNQLTYFFIKGHVSRLLNYLTSLDFNKYKLDFYINSIDQCAYIEIYNLQFSFHNININEKLNSFIISSHNRVKPWKGIRLQKIAGELFNLSLVFREMSKQDTQ